MYINDRNYNWRKLGKSRDTRQNQIVRMREVLLPSLRKQISIKLHRRLKHRGIYETGISGNFLSHQVTRTFVRQWINETHLITVCFMLFVILSSLELVQSCFLFAPAVQTFHWHITTRTFSLILLNSPHSVYRFLFLLSLERRGSPVSRKSRTLRVEVFLFGDFCLYFGNSSSRYSFLFLSFSFSQGPDVNRFGLLAPDWRSTRVSPRI